MTHVSYKSKELNYQCTGGEECANNPLNVSVEFERTNYYNPNWSKNSIIIPISGVYIVDVSFNITKVLSNTNLNIKSCLNLNNDDLTSSPFPINVLTTGFTCDKSSSYRLQTLNLLLNKNDKLSVDFTITYTRETPNLNYYILISLLRVG